MAQIPEFLDYALAEAGKTRFDPQTLGGVRQYLQGYLEALERRQSGKAAAEARRAEERQTQLRLDYDQYRRDEALRHFDSLPAIEKASIEALARAKLNARGPIPAYMTQTPHQGRKAPSHHRTVSLPYSRFRSVVGIPLSLAKRSLTTHPSLPAQDREDQSAYSTLLASARCLGWPVFRPGLRSAPSGL